MVLPGPDIAAIRRFCEQLAPSRLLDQVRLEPAESAPSADVLLLLDEVDRDPTAIVWG